MQRSNTNRTVRFRLAGYLFTYRPTQENDGTEARVRVEMWREDPETGERYWITVAAFAPKRSTARAVALALVAWVRSCDVGTRDSVQAQAIAESFALLQERLAVIDPKATGTVRARPVTTLPDACGGTPAAAA